jgi:glycosyltransferase involved in cell wall biosynthesis
MLDPWFKRTYPLKHIKKWFYWNAIERHILHDARVAVFTSEEERRLAPQSFGNVSCQSTVISLGTTAPAGDPDSDRESFYRRFPELRGKRIVLFLGRIHEKKGCELLIDAFAELRSRPNSEDIHLALAGPCADGAYIGQLRRQAEAAFAGTTAPITWPGMLRGEDKWGAYHAAEAFVLPSHQENFGLAVIEALACGVPVLLSNKVNIWREIDEDQAGLVEEDSVTGTARLLSRWFALDAAAQKRMRTAAVHCFRKRFEIGAAAEKLACLLTQVTDRELAREPAVV